MSPDDLIMIAELSVSRLAGALQGRACPSGTVGYGLARLSTTGSRPKISVVRQLVLG